MKRLSKAISCVLVCGVTWSNLSAYADVQEPIAAMPMQAASPTAAQLEQLVAPIALYPDALVAQILAAATYPDEVVQADRWVQQHPGLKGEELARNVDQEPWDSSVKALTAFPAVLANMDKNLSWTSSLGDAYVNQEQEVMDTVQVLRQRAQQAGNLQSNAQQAVTKKGKTIVIQPVSPEIVYVPQYDPWLVYGAPIGLWPGWSWYPGLYWDGPGIGFDLGFGIGFFGGFGWGWPHWGADWRRHHFVFNHGRYVSHGRAFFNRHGPGGRGHSIGGRHGSGPRARDGFHDGGKGTGRSHGTHPGNPPRGGFHGGPPHGGFHGGPAHGGFHAPHSGAFGGFAHGGIAHGWGGRGFGSFHGGGSGGGFHGGGGHGGGRR